MFDIAKLDTHTLQEKGLPMTVKHPKTGAAVLDDTGKPVTLTLLGRHSDTARGAARRISERTAEQIMRGVRKTEEQVAADNTDMLVSATVGWSFTKMDGEDFPCTVENAKKFYADPRFRLIKEQALDFFVNEGNFLLD